MHFSIVRDRGRIQSVRLLALVTAFVLSLNSGVAAASTDILSSSSIERAGLTADWYTQIQVGVGGRIINLELQINEDITTRYYLIEYDGRVERISQNDLNAFGEPYGIEGAEKHANIRKEIIVAELAAQRRPDVEVNVRSVTLPKSTIYAADETGKVTAINADTGKLLWTTRVGQRNDPTSGVGASKNHVAIVNGSTLYCLSAEDGKILWSTRCQNSPNAAPAVSDDQVFVPLINGRLEVFSIVTHDEEDKRIPGSFPKSYVSYGKSVAQPLVTRTTVSWATSSGHYSVALLNGRGVSYRIDSSESFVGGGASDGETIYVCTTEGSVFAVDEDRGSIHWEYSIGDRVVSRPVVVGNSIFIFSAEHRMYRLDIGSGRLAEGWEKPIAGVSRFVGLSKDKIYVLNEIDQLMAIELATGTRLGTVAGSQLSTVLPNSQSDRLYIGSENGLLQCLRETGNTYPVFHADEAEKMMAEAKMKDMKEADGDSTDETDEDDPFADDSDPFADDSSDDTDPFAVEDDSQDDPFAADDGKSDDSGDDPFSTDDSGDDGASDDGDDPFADDDDGAGEAEDEEDGGDPFGDG